MHAVGSSCFETAHEVMDMASPGQTTMTEVIIVEAPQAADHARCAGAPQSAGLPAYVGTMDGRECTIACPGFGLLAVSGNCEHIIYKRF